MIPVAQPTAGLIAGTPAAVDRNTRAVATASLPLARLTPAAAAQVQSIVNKPTLFRRLPVHQIQTDEDLFVFLVRHPEVLVGMWDMMGITNVQIRRTGPYTLDAQDGSGTHCTIDLVYGDDRTHLFMATGRYDGKLVARPVRGRGVFVVHHTTTPTAPTIRSNASGVPNASALSGAINGNTVSSSTIGTLDCFLQLDNLGADLLARTLGGLIGRSADHNFQETARFVQQVSNAARTDPAAMLDVARRLPQTDALVRQRFASEIRRVAVRR